MFKYVNNEQEIRESTQDPLAAPGIFGLCVIIIVETQSARCRFPRGRPEVHLHALQ